MKTLRASGAIEVRSAGLKLHHVEVDMGLP